ncbi:MAG: hypothetical protein NTZ56_12400 [Acidobacteria bacterium]|nr:hypothetical protein [Acidobacteriota bacterium]
MISRVSAIAWGISWAAAAAFLCVPAAAQQAQLRPAPLARFSNPPDSNSPAFWRDGQFHLFTSGGFPLRAQGPDQFAQSAPVAVEVSTRDHYPLWFEAIYADSDGTLYAWYHHEPRGVCPESTLTAPQIGAAVSTDGGLNFVDLGIVLTAGDPPDCSSPNGYFAGGHGDFSVIVDRPQEYFYFLFSNYAGDQARQGVAMARMPFADRAHPVGRVNKYFDGQWTEPGLGGRLTAILPARTSWQSRETDAFWGPSVHWNTHLESYVILLNRSCCEPGWPTEGIYVMFNPDLSNPEGFSEPAKLLDRPAAPNQWYPQVLGLEEGGTDRLAGRVARFYLQGNSDWEIVFLRPEELTEEPEPERPEPEKPEP